MKKRRKKNLEKITVDRKIVEGLREGRSVTSLTKSTGKSKGYVVKIKNMAIEYGYVLFDEENKIYKTTLRKLPHFPEALFSLNDGRS